MNRHQDKLVVQARKIRTEEKLSFKQIGEKLNVPSGTVRNWCAGMDAHKYDSLLELNQIKRLALKKSEIGIIPEFEKITSGEAKFFAALLYGCEGSKYPATTTLSFSNSDPYLVAMFYRLLKKGFELNLAKLHVHLQIHTTHNYLTIKKFWSNLLEIPESRFMQPTIREPSGGKHRENYLGTCSLRYGDYRIQLKLQGVYEEFLRKMQQNR